MPRTPATANLPAGTIVPATGIYVVSHRSPAHALPHQVLIQAGVKLPEWNACVGVVFSPRCYAPQPIGVNEFGGLLWSRLRDRLAEPH
jgi:hypothetical protein